MSRIRRGPMQPGFEPYCDASGKWRWRLFAANGQVVAASNECFATKAGCKRAIRAVHALVLELPQ